MVTISRKKPQIWQIKHPDKSGRFSSMENIESECILATLSQCSTTGVAKAVVCAILSGDGAYKRTLALN